MTETYVRAGRIKSIAKGSDVGVQERTLYRGESIPWHYHTEVTDTTYCLEGTMQIETLGPAECVLLTGGRSHAVPPNRPHRITPYGNEPCRFLLVQGVGKYDRHPVEPRTWKGPAAESP
jgi:mannose-6-phosphate isomerase-like protein (cupin superfamily)